MPSQKAQIILDAAKVSAASGGNSEPKQKAAVAECEGLFAPKHDAGTANPILIPISATQMPCRAAERKRELQRRTRCRC